MKTGIYVGYSWQPQKVFIVRSTATRHLVVREYSWKNREEMYERSIRYFEDKMERTPSQFYQERLTKILGHGTADSWIAKSYGIWVTHSRVFNTEEGAE